MGIVSPSTSTSEARGLLVQSVTQQMTMLNWEHVLKFPQSLVDVARPQIRVRMLLKATRGRRRVAQPLGRRCIMVVRDTVRQERTHTKRETLGMCPGRAWLVFDACRASRFKRNMEKQMCFRFTALRRERTAGQ